MPRRNTSPWVWVGCGCLGAIVLAVGACMSLGFFGFQFARNLEEELRDPVLREQRAREILGAEELPAGFHAQMHLSVPMLMEMVVLSDGRPIEFRDDGDAELEAANLGDNALIYIALRAIGDARQDFERMLEGNTGDLESVDFDLDFRSEELVSRGEFDLPPQHIRYATHRGEYRDGRERSNGTYTVLLVDCPQSSRVRAAFYWQREVDPRASELPPEAGPETRPAEAATNVSEDDLRRLMGHFQLCEA